MALLALLAPALFDLLEPTKPQIVCAFGSNEGVMAEIHVIDRDFEMTTNGQFKIGLVIGGEALPGRVAPYSRSETRDVVMRARSGEVIYLIALRDDGTALLRYRRDGTDEVEFTGHGSCSGFERHLDRWLGF